MNKEQEQRQTKMYYINAAIAHLEKFKQIMEKEGQAEREQIQSLYFQQESTPAETERKLIQDQLAKQCGNKVIYKTYTPLGTPEREFEDRIVEKVVSKLLEKGIKS